MKNNKEEENNRKQFIFLYFNLNEKLSY